MRCRSFSRARSCSRKTRSKREKLDTPVQNFFIVGTRCRSRLLFKRRPLPSTFKKGKETWGTFLHLFSPPSFYVEEKKTPCTSNIFSLPSCTRTLLSSLLRAKTDHHLFFSLVLFIENKQGFEESRSGICAKHTGVSRLDVFNSNAVGSHEWCRKNYRLYVGATVRID